MKRLGIFRKILQWLKKIIKSFRSVGIWNWIGIASLAVGIAGVYLTIKTTDSTTFTILVRDWKGGKDPFIYESGGKIRIWLEKKPQEYKSIVDGKVEFPEILAEYNNKAVRIDFQQHPDYNSLYIKNDSILLRTKAPSILKIYVRGLESIKGSVKIKRTSIPIDSAKIEINGIVTFTDSLGLYYINIPLEKQELIQEITISKEKFVTLTEKLDMITNEGYDFELTPKK